jgi:hypothetical protein
VRRRDTVDAAGSAIIATSKNASVPRSTAVPYAPGRSPAF